MTGAAVVPTHCQVCGGRIVLSTYNPGRYVHVHPADWESPRAHQPVLAVLAPAPQE